ncbi:unnamed protein product [Arabis nemorensis]|uniref:Uncharacterized protein n=1 Tax=Arabis nemorensis TaxID=586526 RepID=A0A565AM67_9BRAS|nr:unnamed protein product [Arabis nemorensis]
MVAEIAFEISPEIIGYHFVFLLMQSLVQGISATYLKSQRNKLRFRQLPPVMEAFHSWFVVGMCQCFDFFQDQPVISVMPNIRSMDVFECIFQRGIRCLDQRIWDPGIVYSWGIEESMQERIWSIINNIRRLWSFIQEMIAKND